MSFIRKLLIIILFSNSIYAEGNIVTYGVDIVVIKKPSVQMLTKLHYGVEYATKMKYMSLRSANIYIKHLLIKSFRKAKLNASELGKFHIFISKKQLKIFKATGVLLVRLNYKAKAYTQIIMKVSLEV